MGITTETVYLIKDNATEHVYFMVAQDDESYYLCDADGDKVRINDYVVLDELGTIPADDSDAFFSLIEGKAKRVEVED